MPRDVLAAIAAIVHAEAIRRFGATGGVGGDQTGPADRPARVRSAAEPRGAHRPSKLGRWLAAALRAVRRRG
ncbi:hypothetical protein [Gandjariella thermophila]|uniref:Uncharacterized protein n=1 Tax=Gandjariella thermophila TaxID=1931992 RepID=A0A4D4J6X1_9PSEU|nr:hypothetical protein [Gandjariella thermophila]GDY32515.1 hypothetical protein GTS_41480 [Gandjariella thermophila]